MVVWRPTFHDVTVTITLYAAIFSLTFAGMTLWSLRSSDGAEWGVAARRLQSKVGIGCALVAIGIVYLLIAVADAVPRP